MWLNLLHKIWPLPPGAKEDNRPIGAGTGVRRVLTGVVAKEEQPDFIEELLKSNNFGNSKESTHFLAFTLTALCEQIVFRTPEQLKNGNLPTRCLLSLDIHNMLNRMSRKRLRKILRKKFPHLVPLYDALYMKHGLVYFRHADGTVDFITQVEGCTQGCPLGAVFSSLVLGELLLSLNEDLKDRCRNRTNKHGDKGFTETVAFFDDNNIVILLEDVFWYLSEFISRGAKYGCTMNIDKTKIFP